MHSRFSTIIGAVGRTLIGFGLVVLAFAGYQLWGTGVLESRSQDKLETAFAERQAAVAALGATPSTTTPSTTTPSTTTPSPQTPSTLPPSTLPVVLAPELAAELIPAAGDPLGFIRIPAIGLERAMVEGIGRDDLRKGPGHYSSTPLPGQAGNAAVAGHRTTYGQPFYDLDRLQPGDLIEIETLQGIFFYEVMPQTAADGTVSGHFIIDPSQVEVIENFGDNRLTLTACHPKASARQRIVVTALMVGAPAPTIAAPEEPIVETDDSNTATDVATEAPVESLDDSLGWNFEHLQPTLLWGSLAALVMITGWLAGRAWRRWPAYLLTTPFFLGVLFFTFIYLDRMLPAF